MRELFPVIECAGTPYEIGYAHGSKAKNQVNVTIDTYRTMFKDYSNIEWSVAKNYAKTFIPAINEYDENIMDEIKGIADGSGYELEDILALNVRSEIVLQGSQVNMMNRGCGMDGCTTFAFTPKKTITGETWVGQNWDWKITQRKGCAILHIKQQNKPDITMVTEAGIVGKIGYNSAGVGITLNALASDKIVEGKVIPMHIALRGVLNSATLADAIRAAGIMPLSCCANFTMASSSGQGICVEIGPGDIDVIYADDGYCVHTNHFYSPRMTAVRDTGRISLSDTYLRLGRIKDLIKESNSKLSLNDVKNILRDTLGYPDSICRYEDVLEPIEKRLGTIFSIIMVLDRQEMYFAPGNPIESNYNLYKF